uniref:SWIM-type domain-containing protein n=1 Tax=Panagrolaimus davidi TaxID=227884 RepID=A0A914R0S0_9BILA
MKVSHAQFAAAYSFKQSEPSMKSVRKNSEFYVKSSKLADKELFASYVVKRRNLNYDSWSDYVKVVESCYYVKHSEAFKETLYCSCPVGSKKFACKHVVSVACKLKYLEYPPSIDSIQIQGPRSPGRQRGAKRGHALSRL